MERGTINSDVHMILISRQTMFIKDLYISPFVHDKSILTQHECYDTHQYMLIPLSDCMHHTLELPFILEVVIKLIYEIVNICHAIYKVLKLLLLLYVE